ncbi:MAG: hypothetical protein JNK05_13500 [Myxococcales bacterium]|nr:hypothetical protein [Myxococcales bacterium]
MDSPTSSLSRWRAARKAVACAALACMLASCTTTATDADTGAHTDTTSVDRTTPDSVALDAERTDATDRDSSDLDASSSDSSDFDAQRFDGTSPDSTATDSARSDVLGEDGATLDARSLEVCGTLEVARAARETGSAFILPMDFGLVGDTPTNPTRSTVSILEDGVALGPAHSAHATIRATGRGTFSHWGNSLYFSASDNSDPRSNGRRYTWAAPSCWRPRPITVRDVAAIQTIYGTFQSHNQRVVRTRDGTFLSYLRRRTDSAEAHWVLARSTDDGLSWSTVREGMHGTNAPSLETDSADALYVVHSDWRTDQTGPGYFYRYNAGSLAAPAVEQSIPNGTGSKFTTCWDAFRSRLYVLTFWDELPRNFFTIRPDGSVERALRLYAPGPRGAVQYPHCKVIGSDLYVAWTTDPVGSAPMGLNYRDIHFVLSRDGGASWVRGPWNLAPLTLPITADETGPATQVVLPDELDTNTWLSNFVPTARSLHLMYYAAAPLNRQHAVRFDLSTGARSIDRQPRWLGNGHGLRTLDGFFVDDTARSGLLFAVGAGEDGRLTVLATSDDGQTWFDFAVGPAPVAGRALYAIAGSRSVSSDGFILGAYTAQDVSATMDHRVQYFTVDTRGVARR